MKLIFVRSEDGWTDVVRKVRKTGEAKRSDESAIMAKTNARRMAHKYPEELKEEMFTESNPKANTNGDVPTSSRLIVVDSPSDVSIPVPWIPTGSRRNLKRMSIARYGNYVPTKAGPGFYTYGTFGDFGLEY